MGVDMLKPMNRALAKLVSSLLSEADIETEVLGIGLSTEDLAKLVLREAIENLANPLSDTLDVLLETLGIHAGEGDYMVNGVKCNRAVLVE